MIKRVIEFLKEYNLQDKTIILGFSGGYDSMCLLDILSKIKENEEDFQDMNIIAAHFNHNWRGCESLKEQEVCRLFAASRGVTFYIGTAPDELKKTEAEARIARYEFFEEAYEMYDADAVFTAHNKDDNAETVLYRMIKGTGIVGLRGISIKRRYFYRPFLKTARAEIMKYCKQNNLSPNNDSSNSDIKYKRNYLRLNIIPALEKINPSVKDTLNTLAEVAANENDIIEEYLEKIRITLYDEEGRIKSPEFILLSKPVKMRIIHEYIQKFNLDYDFKRVKKVYDFLEKNALKRNGSTLSLATALWLYCDDKIIEPIPRYKPADEDIPALNIEISCEGSYEIGNGQKLVLKKYTPKDIFVFPEAAANFVYVDISDIKFPLILRNRKDGDVINPFGMKGTMKLKKYLNSKGVPRHKRSRLLILTNAAEEVLWVAGVGLSNKIGVTTVPTHVIEII